MKFALVCLLLAVTAALAEDGSTNYYIERYPGDGMKQRPQSVPKKKIGDAMGVQDGLAEAGASSTNAVTNGTNTTTKAARYISPRVGSKDFAPSRLAEPKAKTVVLPDHEKKLRPSPKLNDKVGATEMTTKPSPATTSTNAPAATGEPTKP
jgi:hypothetical protein